jgi:hypothetical protein
MSYDRILSRAMVISQGYRKVEIMDKSKGDFISKAVVILQTSWFVMQCIARRCPRPTDHRAGARNCCFRGSQFFHIRYVVREAAGFAMWSASIQETKTEKPVDDGHIEAAAGFWAALRDALFKLPSEIAKGPLIHVLGPEYSWPRRVFIWPFIKTQQVLGIAISNQRSANLKKKIATFYPETWERRDRSLALFAATLVALTFGGIHCVGSIFIFPSNTEQILWRVASASIAGIPIILFLWIHALFWVTDEYPERQALRTFLRYTLRLQVFAYFLCRLTLLVLPFLCLRSLPPTAYHVVHWALFIPHI